MGIFIVGIVFVIIAIVLKIIDSNSYHDFGFSSTMTAALGVGIIAICAVVFFIVGYNDKRLVIGYNNDKAYIESCYVNENLTDAERTRVNDLIITDNNIILTAKLFRDDFWIGAFQYKMVAGLEPFDASRIPTSKTKIEITKDGD